MKNERTKYQPMKRAFFLPPLVLALFLTLFAYPTTSVAKTLHQPSFLIVGGSRQVIVDIPAGYLKGKPAPLLIDLHGYMGNGVSEKVFSRLQAAAASHSIIYAAPDGSVDLNGDKFWNASTTCCNFYKSKVDDVAYIKSLIKEISAKVSIDPKRIYLFGHSNGDFMVYKYACTYPNTIAAIGGIAGAMNIKPGACTVKAPMNVLHIHGTSDEVVNYDGGFMYKNQYPSVKETIGQWLAIDKCSSPPVVGSPFDIVVDLPGAETTPTKYTCPTSTVELWTIADGLHRPVLDWNFGNRVIDWFLAHPRK